MKENFYFWVLNNECFLKRQKKAQPFILNCLHDYNLCNFSSEKDLFNYLWVNGYSESILLSFLTVWKSYEYSTKINLVTDY